MSERQHPSGHADLSCESGRLPREMDARGARRFERHLHIGPCDPAAPACSDGFEHRFLRGESSRQMFIPASASLGVRALAVGETACEKPLPMPLDHADNTGDFYEIDTVADEEFVGGAVLRAVSMFSDEVHAIPSGAQALPPSVAMGEGRGRGMTLCKV